MTDIEFNTVVGTLFYKEELELPPPPSGNDLRRLILGFRGDTLCLVGLAVEKRAMRAYGTAMALFAMAESCRYFFKIGGAAGRFPIGTIAVLSRGDDQFVLHGKTVPVVGSFMSP